MELYEAHAKNVDNSASMLDWCDEMYRTVFDEYFREIRELRSSLSDKSKPITDDELETVLTTVPLNLFAVSEALNKFKLEYEMTKLELRNAKRNKQDTTELEILSIAYSTVISRVETEISFSRELIMGVKKIWDGRRSTERSNPVSDDPLNSLPDYVPEVKKNKYIK